jgi:hypothetical protein
MRIDVNENGKSKKDQIGVGLLALFAVLFTVAYILGSPAYASAFPHSVERALINVRKEVDKATEGFGYTVAGVMDTVRNITGR